MLAATVLFLAGTADAQDTERRRPRDEAFRMVDAYVIAHLQEGLGLSDEEFVAVLPLVKTLQGDRRDYHLGRAQGLRELRRLLRSGTATEAEVTKKLAELDAHETDGPVKIRRDVEAIDARLSPLQRAKFRVFEADVEQRVREVMGRARERRARPPEPPQ
jgi:hypothetical protein